MPSQHALLSPSSSKRWLHCTPSARLESMMPNKETSYTMEGTIAHGMAEEILRYLISTHARILNPETIAEWRAQKELFNSSSSREMLDWVAKAVELGLDPWEIMETVNDCYVNIVMEDYSAAKAQDPDAELLVEAELKLSEYIPEGFGSSDAIILSGNTLHVYDLKYGKGVKVDAERNTQMLCYALGAYCGPAELYDIKHVEMTIIQPRLDHVSTWAIELETLLAWARHVLKPAAEVAFKGKGQPVAGEHCKFCRVAAICKTLRDYALARMTTDPIGSEDEKLMAPEEVGEALSHLPAVKIWMESLESYALNEALEGRGIPGYKLVEGTSKRSITDQDKAQKLIKEAGLDVNDYLKPRELKSLTDLEKLMKKKAFNAILGPVVIKPKGKPTLVPASDPRPVYTENAVSDFSSISI